MAAASLSIALSTWAGAQVMGWAVRQMQGRKGHAHAGAPPPPVAAVVKELSDADDEGEENSSTSTTPRLLLASSSSAPPLPPGIANAGATCFFNALLQALAVTDVSEHARASAAWAAAVLRDREGPSNEGGRDGAPRPPPPALVAPQLALLDELASILGALASPAPPKSSSSSTLSASRLLAAARSAAPPFRAAIQPHTQHDSAEALDLLADALAGAARAVELAVRGEGGGGGGAGSPTASRPGSAASPVAPKAPPPPPSPLRRRARPTSPGLSELLAAPPRRGAPPPPRPGPPPPPRSPLAGALVFEGACAACRAPREAAVTGFATLPLPVPVVASPASLPASAPVVRPGCSLEDCLASWARTEAVAGLECVRCSLVATVRAVLAGGDGAPGGALQPPPPPQQKQKGDSSVAARLRRLGTPGKKKKVAEAGATDALTTLRALAACPGPVSEEAAKAAAKAAGAAWVPARATALRRCLLARPPRVLALQLSRAVAGGGEEGGGPVKAVGRVSFPLALDVAGLTLAGAAPLLLAAGAGAGAEEDGRRGGSGGGATGSPPPPPPPPPAPTRRPVLYDLAAIVEHGGSRAARGHYTAWRRARREQPPRPAPPPEGGAGGGGSGGARPPPAPPAAWSDTLWHRASDKRVTVASQEDALRAEAALLLYVRRD